MRQVEKRTIGCDLCDGQSRFSVLAVRLVDGDLLDDASYCRKHALEVALGLGGPWIRLSLSRVGTTMHQCYLDGCECLPQRLERCSRCTRLADLGFTVLAGPDLDDLELWIYLCGPCAVKELKEPALPAEVRRALQHAAKQWV